MTTTGQMLKVQLPLKKDMNHTKAGIAINSLENSWLLNSPLPDICPLLITSLVVFLLRVRDLPPSVPIFCELFKEGRFDRGRLRRN